MLFNVENFLENLAFCLLFLTMLVYWIAIGSAQASKIVLIARSSIIVSNLSLFIFLLFRWKESGHFPLSNLYESLIFLAWSLTFIQIVIENKNATSILGKEASFIGAILAPSALLTYVFATFSLPPEMQKTSALVPALQSNWLVMHVTIMLLSYASLICGCLLSIAFLIITRNDNEPFSKEISNFYSEAKKKKSSISEIAQIPLNSATNNLGNNLILTTNIENGIDLNNLQTTNLSAVGTGSIAKNLDNLSYRILGIGFPLLTIGILSGSVWANEAWGSYWSWDPKETWALLTWLVFAIYLHTRLTKGWEGKKPAIIASFGFIIVWICFIGVNLLGKGLHSYGWLS
uniref:Cytochrome c biogenesis protein CcsA n=1 Tax=Chaetophoropsis polyrhiza TaxID=2079440 RepID=A0A6H1U5V7_9CHLO|nr:heme attachment to plastid cytochrome c [Chaetophoropsis polyrhiza]QIZ74234.1 heme attachment to plastid cytochrome c [Chaetophoropsis polyrhiza]